PEPSVAFSSSVQPPEFEVEVEIVKPLCLGMCFETLEAAKQFYIDYGKSFGFSPVIRSSENSFSRSDELVYEAMETDSAYQLMLQRLQELSVELKKQKEVDPGVSVVNSYTIADSSAPPLDDPSQVKSVTGSKILRIPKALGITPKIPKDLYHLIKKVVAIHKHLEKNTKDNDCTFRLILVESRIHRLFYLVL
ncbi:hypothetical protein IFM89_034520, partial [Coptis chinensis]